METIQFDSGLRSYRLGGGVLRFNPADPNLYARFLDSVEQLKAVEEELTAQAAEDVQNRDILRLLRQADEKMKAILNRVFGGDNDFAVLLQDINLLAVAENGERVVTNLFAALEPVLVAGARECAAGQAARIRAEQEAGA